MLVKQSFKSPTSLQEAENLINIYQQLIKVNSLITSSLNQKEVLTMVMSEAKNILNSESCSLLLLDKTTEELVIDIALGKKGHNIQEIRIPKGQGIAGWVAQNQEDLIVNDVANDSRHFKQVDKKSSYDTKNMICTPLINGDQLIGVIQVINKNNDIFNNFDLHVLKNISIQAVTAINNAQLYEQAITDALTKTFTRRYLDMQLHREIENFKRHNRNFSTIMIDIDHFKMINDTHGHQAGDDILINMANIFKETVREVDIVCRYGGEEFTIICPNTDSHNAINVAERVRKNVENFKFIIPQGEIKVTISLGVAEFEQNCTLEDPEIIKKADLALYHAKETGRNQTIKYSLEISE